jgi:hypothetical protein
MKLVLLAMVLLVGGCAAPSRDEDQLWRAVKYTYDQRK